jgi:hypothetical protein
LVKRRQVGTRGERGLGFSAGGLKVLFEFRHNGRNGNESALAAQASYRPATSPEPDTKSA